MSVGMPVIAGIVSTTIFAASTLPMLWKAARTKDLRSYSLGNLLLSNVANLVHSVYVVSLPLGPVWALHGFYLAATAVMLIWALRYRRDSRSAPRRSPAGRHPVSSAPSLAYQEVAAA